MPQCRRPQPWALGDEPRTSRPARWSYGRFEDGVASRSTRPASEASRVRPTLGSRREAGRVPQALFRDGGDVPVRGIGARCVKERCEIPDRQLCRSSLPASREGDLTAARETAQQADGQSPAQTTLCSRHVRRLTKGASWVVCCDLLLRDDASFVAALPGRCGKVDADSLNRTNSAIELPGLRVRSDCSRSGRSGHWRR